MKENKAKDRVTETLTPRGSMPENDGDRLDYVATCLFGLEGLVGEEIDALGYERTFTMDGRVGFRAGVDAAARCNMWLRTAERLYVSLGSFPAPTFDALFEGAKALPWERFIGREDAFPVKGHALNSKLHSIPDCQKIIKKACVKRLEKAYGISYFEETAAKHQIQFAIHKDIATIYLDTSGVGLHKRGYRRNSNDAPIKETLAAGIVDLARVRADSVVVDPMCGSGTFLIESAYKALKVAPGLRRNFAAEQWSQIPETAWRNARAEAMDAIDRQGAFKAFGFDVDDIAVELTRNNAKKAGVGSKLTVKQQDISKYSQIEGSITIVNPPYGERMLEIKEAEELYKKMGQRLCPSKENPCYIISPHEEFEVFFGKKADKKRKLYNGMIKCNLYMYFK